ncbi:MAG: hypothetical protein O7G83_12860, partial [Proteobacteria bacterium]|nr:hypothetical protein [Pseudomonadota bacterium]
GFAPRNDCSLGGVRVCCGCGSFGSPGVWIAMIPDIDIYRGAQAHMTKWLWTDRHSPSDIKSLN